MKKWGLFVLALMFIGVFIGGMIGGMTMVYAEPNVSESVKEFFSVIGFVALLIFGVGSSAFCFSEFIHYDKK